MYLASPDSPAFYHETIKGHGLKSTPQRLAIYNAVSGLKTHPSADEVYRIVSGLYTSISFDTVNRTLLKFAEIGLIAFAESVSGVRRFEPDLQVHHHLHCVKCGAITDFNNPEFDALEAPPDIRRRFMVLSTKVSLTGICAGCAKKEKHRKQVIRP